MHPIEEVLKAKRQEEGSYRPKVQHYLEGGIQPIDFINSNNLNYNLGCVIKYITRCNYKGSKQEDLLKAIDYINFELEKETDVRTR